MEEVDKIILASLKDIGSSHDDELIGLHEFTPQLLIEGCVRCLKITNPNYEGSHIVPEAMSAKYRTCTDLAKNIKDLGYPGEIGYQTFLYSSPKEWRKLLMFLLEKLPKEKAQITNEPLGTAALMNKAFSAELARQLKIPWTPSSCKRNSVRWLDGDTWHLEGRRGLRNFHSVNLTVPKDTDQPDRHIPKALKRYEHLFLPLVSDQPSIRDDLIASLIQRNSEEFVAQQEWETEWNQAGLASRLSEADYRERKRQQIRKKVNGQLKSGVGPSQSSMLSTSIDFNQLVNSFATDSKGGRSTRFQKTEKLQFTMEEGLGSMESAQTEEDLRRQREQELVSLQEQLASITESLEGMEMDIKKFLTNQQQLLEMTATQEARNKELEDAYRVKKKTIDLLPNAEENIVTLEGVVDASSERLVKLATKWEEHRGPLIGEYRHLKAAHTASLETTGGLVDQIKAMRIKMKELAEEGKMKEELYRRLAIEQERMNKGQNRSSYTKRIMEIVNNISKQKDGIAVILADTQLVQREINQLSGKLDRLFIVVDEQIFKDAKVEQASRTAYKHLASLREKSALVLDAIREIWQVRRQIKDLKEQIDNESSKKVAATLEKISSDLLEMKEENKQLVAKIKARKE